MTVTTTHAYKQFNGNGVTTVFAVDFQFYLAAELLVTLIAANGTETVKSLTTHYTVSGGAGSTGTVTMLTAPASGEKLRVERATVATQETNFALADRFSTKSLNEPMDRREMRAQEIDLDARRAIKQSMTNFHAGSQTELEFPAPVAGKFIAWNDEGAALVNMDGIQIDDFSLLDRNTLHANDSFGLYDGSESENAQITYAELLARIEIDFNAATSLGPNSVTNTLLDDMGAWTIKGRADGTTGDPSDVAPSDLTTASLASGHFALGWLGSGQLRKYDLGSFYFPGNTDVGLADGGTGSSLSDPGGDRIMFWDESLGAVTWLQAGANIQISGTTISASLESGAGIGSLVEDTSPQLGGNLDLNTFVIMGMEIGADIQAYSSNLDDWSGAAVTDYYTVAQVDSGFQPLDAQLTSLSSASANGVSLVMATDYATMRGLLDLEAGTDFYSITAADAAFQPLDSDLTAIAGLSTTAAGRSVLAFADPGADRIIAWDDSAGAITSIALADIASEASPAAGDYLLAYTAEGALVKVDWDDLPAGGGGSMNEVADDTSPTLGGDLEMSTFSLFSQDDKGIYKTGTAEEIFHWRAVSSAVNHVEISNAATGNPALIYAIGETDANLELRGNGAGGVIGTFTNSGLHLLDANASHDLIVSPGSNLTADRTLSIITGDADRTLTIGANSSISGTAYVGGGTDVALADGGTGASLSDPGADRIVFWDDGANSVAWLEATGGIAISGTQILLSDSGLGAPTGFGSGDKIIIFEGGAPKVIDYDDLPGSGGGLSNLVEDTTPQLGGDLDANSFDILFDDNTGIRDDSDNELLIFQKTGSAVNHIEVTNSATTTAPSLLAAGEDTNIDLILGGKGTGGVIATFADDGLRLRDTNASHALILQAGSDLSADRILQIITGDSARTLTLTGDASIGGTAYVASGTDVALADGGTGASLTDPGADRIMFWDDSAGAVTWLTPGTGLAISDTTFGLDAELAALAGVTSAADKVPYFTGSGSASVADFTSYGRSLVAVANEAGLKSLINLEANTDFYAPAGTDVALADGGTGASLSDPGADRIMFWDESDNVVKWLAVNVGLEISGTNLNVNSASTSTAGISEIATDAEVRASTANKVIDAGLLSSAAAVVALTDAATVAIDWSAGVNFQVTLTTNRVLGNPTNEVAGQWRTVLVKSDGGPDTLSFGSEYGGEVPTIDDVTTSQFYLLSIYCKAAGQFLVTAIDGSDA